MGVFDVVGTIMIGPSSSHTAGAARLGKMARIILGDEPAVATITLYGSFARTYAGHGTDKALVAGLLGLAADDPLMIDALQLAEAAGLAVAFRTSDARDRHPNTVEFLLQGKSGGIVRVAGISVGGGRIQITGIDDFKVEISGEYPTLIIVHHDRPGVIASVTRILARAEINIAFMRVSRQDRGAQALTIVEVDQVVPAGLAAEIEAMPAIRSALAVGPF